jgi:hypothetical protein
MPYPRSKKLNFGKIYPGMKSFGTILSGNLYSNPGHTRRQPPGRSGSGLIMPFVALSVILLMGTAGIATDMMRNFQAVRELKFAAQETALYALSLSTTAGGVYLQSSIQDAILTPTTTLSNNAQIGPNAQSQAWTAPVLFAPEDILFVQNPADNAESFLQLTARRQGATALGQFLLPLVFTGFNSALPQSIQTFDTAQTIEVLGQPATRIGAGPPLGQTTSARAADFTGCAALPIAITYQQFASAVASKQGTANDVPAVVNLVSSTNPNAINPAAFVNLTATSGGVTYYGGAQGTLAVAQLKGLLSYFTAGAGSQAITAIPPSNIETGFQLSAYDPADPSFTGSQNQAQIVSLVNNLPARTYVLPVVSGGQGNQLLLATANNPNALNTVVGFAYVRFPQKQTLTSPPFSLSFEFVASPPPLRNVSSAAGLASWPLGTSNLMPAPLVVFLPRAYDSASGGVTPRFPGVALAPALSPRPN